MNSPRHSVSVAAIITDDHGRALLVQRRDNQLATEAYAVRVLDALRADQPPAIRQHDGIHLL